MGRRRSDKPTTMGCGLLGEAPGHLSAPLFWGRAARDGLGSAGCPLPLQRLTGQRRLPQRAPAQRGTRSAGEVGMVRAGGGASCYIVIDPAAFPEILPSSKKRKEKPREPLGLPGKGRASGNQGSQRSHGPGWSNGASCLGQRPISPETESGPQPEVSEELTNGIAPGQVHAHWATFVAAELRQEKESLEITGLPTGLFRFWEWGRLKLKFNPDWLLPLLPFHGLTLY